MRDTTGPLCEFDWALYTLSEFKYFGLNPSKLESLAVVADVVFEIVFEIVFIGFKESSLTFVVGLTTLVNFDPIDVVCFSKSSARLTCLVLKYSVCVSVIVFEYELFWFYYYYKRIKNND